MKVLKVEILGYDPIHAGGGNDEVKSGSVYIISKEQAKYELGGFYWDLMLQCGNVEKNGYHYEKSY